MWKEIQGTAGNPEESSVLHDVVLVYPLLPLYSGKLFID